MSSTTMRNNSTDQTTVIQPEQTQAAVRKSRNKSQYAFVQSAGLDLIIGSGMHLAGRLHLGAKPMWRTPTEGNPLNYTIVVPTPQANMQLKYLYTKADSTGSSILLGNGGSFRSAVSKTNVELPKANSQISKDAEDWLAKQAPEMQAMLKEIEKLNPSISSEALAVAAMNIRNSFVNVARQSIADPRVFAKLELERPLWDFRALEADYAKLGYSGDGFHNKLMEDAFNRDKLKLEVKHVQCFPAGTMVHTDKGLVPIQDIKVGDMVLSRPEWGGENAPTEYKRVVRAFCAGEAEVIRLITKCKNEWDDWDEGRNFVQFLTPNHPVWVEQRKDWVPAKDLKTGELLSGLDADDNQMVLSIDKVFKGYFDKNTILGICREPSLGLDESNDVGMYIDFKSEGYSVNYNRFYTGYKGFLFDRDVYFYLNPDIENIIFNDFSEKPETSLEVPVYNLEIDDYHTYFIGQKSIWVHNDDCFYEYVPNLTRSKSPLPKNVKARAPSRADILPSYVVWMPTSKNIKEAFDAHASEGGVFVSPDTWRDSKAGTFERGVWGARIDSNIGKNDSHLEYGVVFENPAFNSNPSVHNWRMYEGAKVLPNGKMQMIDRKRYTWADEDRKYMTNADGTPVDPYTATSMAVKSLIETMYKDVLAMNANKKTVDSVAYSFFSQASADVFNRELRDKIVQDGFGGLKIKDLLDKNTGEIIVSGNDMLLAVQSAFKEGKIFGVFDTKNYQLVSQQGKHTTVDTLDYTSIESLIPAARQYWLDAGASTQVLDQIQFHIGDLGDRVAAITEGAQVTLDRTGAGWGWFIDPTPQEHSEFVQSATLGMDATADSPAHGKLDLLTVLIHEMGHVLGIDPKIADDVMTQVLDTGERRLPSALDAMLLQYNASNRVAQTGQHVLQAKAWTPVASQATLNNTAWQNNGTDWLTQGDIIYSGNRVTLKETTQTHTRLAQAFQVNTGDRASSRLRYDSRQNQCYRNQAVYPKC